jgi:hypothetical protein
VSAPGPDRRAEGARAAGVDAELRRLRRSGAFPPGFEQGLEEAFARVTPRGAGERDVTAALEQVEESVSIDVDVPVSSRKPGFEAVKRAIRAGVSWYFNYLVIQLREFAAATLRVLHILDARVAELEMEAEARRAPPLAERPPVGMADPGSWGLLVSAELAGSAGVVLHADCGPGDLVRQLVEAGVDCYGTDPRAEALGGLDVRREEAASHLRSLSEGSLGGLVLSGCVDRASLGQKHELAHLAATRLAPGAKVVLIGTGPEAWQRAHAAGEAAVVEADLSPGRPLHPETWAYLFRRAGLEVTATHREAARRRLEPVPGDGPAVDVLNADLARLEEALFGPESFAIVGRRLC